MNKNAERIRRFLIFLRCSGAFLSDLINFTKYTMRKINEIIGSAIKRKKIEKESISHLQNLIRKAIFRRNSSAKF